MNEYLFIVDVYYDHNKIDVIDRYGVSYNLNPNTHWALEDQIQDKIYNNEDLWDELCDNLKSHWELGEEPKYDIIMSVTLVNPNDNEMIETYKSLTKLEL